MLCICPRHDAQEMQDQSEQDFELGHFSLVRCHSFSGMDELHKVLN